MEHHVEQEEKDVIRLANQCLSTRVIALKINRSEKSVKSYRKSLFAKLGVSNIAEAIAMVTHQKLIWVVSVRIIVESRTSFDKFPSDNAYENGGAHSSNQGRGNGELLKERWIFLCITSLQEFLYPYFGSNMIVEMIGNVL